MMLKLLLALAALATPALSETLLSGAVYFDSENTLLEVQSFIKEGDQDGLVRLFKGNHISDKVTQNINIVVLSGPSEGKMEFRFIDKPTTYWTYAKYVTTDSPKAASTPPLSPAPNSTLPADLPSSLTASSSVHLPGAMPTPTPTPTPIPTPTPASTPPPTPKSRVAAVREEEDTSERETHPPLRKHRRAKEHPSSSDDEGVPENAKVWHQVNGHWKWYDKRNLKEVRKAMAVSDVFTPVLAIPAQPVSNPTPVPVLRAQPVRP